MKSFFSYFISLTWYTVQAFNCLTFSLLHKCMSIFPMELHNRRDVCKICKAYSVCWQKTANKVKYVSFYYQLNFCWGKKDFCCHHKIKVFGTSRNSLARPGGERLLQINGSHFPEAKQEARKLHFYVCTRQAILNGQEMQEIW